GIVGDLLAERGWALVSVPAYPSLFSAHDRALRHYRRYSPRACRSLLERSGLTVVSSGGLFSSLLPARALQASLERVRLDRGQRNGIGAWKAGGTATAVLTRALITDGKLSLSLSRRGRALPGLSFWALCRRADGSR